MLHGAMLLLASGLLFEGSELSPSGMKTATVGYMPLATGSIDLSITGGEGILVIDSISVHDHGILAALLTNTGCDGAE